MDLLLAVLSRAGSSQGFKRAFLERLYSEQQPQDEGKWEKIIFHANVANKAMLYDDFIFNASMKISCGCSCKFFSNDIESKIKN